MESKIKDTVEAAQRHWFRMVAWVKKQDPTGQPSYNKMRRGIGECYGDEDCALCEDFLADDCEECPLFAAGYRCLNPHSPYMAVVSARTWQEWLVAADGMLGALAEILGETETEEEE